MLGTLSGLAAASIWGAMYVVSKVVLDVIPPFALITTRLLLGGATLYLVLLRRGGAMDGASRLSCACSGWGRSAMESPWACNSSAPS